MYIRVLIMLLVAGRAFAGSPSCETWANPEALARGESDRAGAAQIVDAVVNGDWALELLRPAGSSKDYPDLQVLRRDGACGWRASNDDALRIVPEGSLSEARQTLPLTAAGGEASPALDDDGAARLAAIGDFERTAAAEGVAAALRVYALDQGLRLVIDGTAIARDAGEATLYLKAHPVNGDWHASRRARSGDGTIAYVQGFISDERRRTTRHYVELWQYDPRVANLGLRLLWLGAVTPSAQP